MKRNALDSRIPSPREFLRNRRPENFSDSVRVEKPLLDRSQLEYHLATLTNRSQENDFEIFARGLAERVICPNLLGGCQGTTEPASIDPDTGRPYGTGFPLFTVRDHFKVASLDGFGLKDRTAATGAAGAVLHYLTQHLRRDAANLTRLSFYQRSDFLALDFTTLRHLEILEPLHHDAPRNACLYGALNRTVTPMGARRLRD